MTTLFTILLGILGSLLATEISGVLPWVTETLLLLASRRVPAQQRERYIAEWYAEVDFMKRRWGNVAILLWAAGVYFTSRRLADELKELRPAAPTKQDRLTLPLFGLDLQQEEERQDKLVVSHRRLDHGQKSTRLTRRDRRDAIREILMQSNRSYVSEEEILDELHDRGFVVTQPTLLRDLDRLALSSLMKLGKDGGYLFKLIG